MILILFRLLARLPLRTLQSIGRLGGRLIFALPGRYRDRLKFNVRQAGYHDPGFAWRAAAETGAMIMELPKIWLRTQECLALVHDDHKSLIANARSAGRPILFLTPHLGCFEITGRYGAEGAKFTVMFRPPRKQSLVPLMDAARSGSGITAVPANIKGVRAFLRALKNGESVGMLPDQVPREGDGVWAPFFGKQAFSVTLPGKLARATNPLIIVTACERLPKGQGWRMHFNEVLDPVPEDPVEQAALFNREMEKMIRKFPEQYLWGYYRYKRPSSAPPPPPDPPAEPASAAGTDTPGHG
ncbi:lysophospholipid acyltransferase family protein [Orrella marina]|uniref:Lysophospholipid acyltransferase family protein n=1 Tax=Orrella marina TaxID=2163011 RepID=A0A2R4XL98_9BURK|nr:lysophospholipid acyltransferase family protein [Orrella marina]AWB34565.1 lysophospholipid acyltransferase family protein [Orrella marina]